MRKLISLMICILLVISTAVPAFASDLDPADGDGTGDTPPAGCTEHSYGEGSITTQPTCVNAGVKTFTCTNCGATKTEAVSATGVHTPGAWQNADGTNHKRVCTGCGGAEETAAHSWDSGSVTTQPTCSATGVKTFTCGCGASKTETLPTVVGSHTYGNWVVGDANHSRTCSGCGNSESGAHNLAVSATVPATCLQEGATAYGCIVCGGILYEILPKLTTHTYDTPCDTDCNVCGAIRETKHKFNTLWSKNSKEHWHACTLCGEKTDVGGHYPGPAATEEKAQLCLTCGLTLTPKLNHVHKFAVEWTSDETGHWYACDGCDEQKDFKEHTYDDLCDPDCNVCGFETTTAHSYDGSWLSDESGHWGTCTVCNEEGRPIAHVPDPEAAETEALLCTVCGFEIRPASEHVHEGGESWMTDKESHWKVCECGEKLEEAPHSWNEGTENADSTITYICTECQAEKTEGEPKAESGFPLGIVLVVLILIIAGAVVALILVLRSGKASGKYSK